MMPGRSSPRIVTTKFSSSGAGVIPGSWHFPRISFRPVSISRAFMLFFISSMGLFDAEKSTARKMANSPLRQFSSTSVILPFISKILVVIFETSPGESGPMAERLRIFSLWLISHPLSFTKNYRLS